jgi:hypothetical protein
MIPLWDMTQRHWRNRFPDVLKSILLKKKVLRSFKTSEIDTPVTQGRIPEEWL